MVQRDGLVDKLTVRADGTGQVGHAGSALLTGVADRVGLTRALSAAASCSCSKKRPSSAWRSQRSTRRRASSS
jgi:hypothetical protein